MSKEIIPIASDHAGYKMKKLIINYLSDKGFETKDFGTYSEDSCDYPIYIHKVADSIENNTYKRGIILCGSGNGASMTANKHKNVRAALSWKKELAELARLHNDANIVTLPARFISDDEAFEIVDAFLNTSFEGGRHIKRVNMIENI